MEKVLLLVLPAAILAIPVLRDSQPAVTREMVDLVNSQGRWTASWEQVEGLTIGDARQRLNRVMRRSSLPPAKLHGLRQFFQAPPYFNATEEWPGCIHPIRNQGKCGAGWAFAAAGVLSDRICISTNGAVDVVLSPQYLVSCSPTNEGCGGGYSDLTWHFASYQGIPAEDCMPYSSGDSDETGACVEDCEIFYKATNLVSLSEPIAIQASLMMSGPVETTFYVFQDFLSYSSGIYTHTTGDFVGPHSAKIVGWGVQDGVYYWVAANSWGEQWGMDGYFWIEFGQCDFEVGAISADFAQ